MHKSSRAADTSMKTIFNCHGKIVVKFLVYEGVLACDIHRILLPAYGPSVMNRQKVGIWVRVFRKGRTNVHDEKRSGRPSLVSDGFVQKVDQIVREP